MEGEVEDALPLGALFAPDEDLAVVARRGEDVAVFGVGPGDAPDCSFVTRRTGFALATDQSWLGELCVGLPFQSLSEAMALPLDLEDLYGPV